MSSVSASASEFPELFNEETGEVLPSFEEDMGEAPFAQAVSNKAADATDNSTPADNPRPRSVNSFGHDRFNLDLEILYPLERGKSKQTAFTYEAGRRIDSWAENPDSYPAFNDAICKAYKGRMRSQMREKMARMLKAMLRRLDVATMFVGKPSPNGMHGWSVKSIAKLARIPKRGGEYALYWLNGSGLLKSFQQIRKLEPSDKPYHGKCVRKEVKGVVYEYYASLRQFAVEFFMLLGFSEKDIEVARTSASNRIKEEAKKMGAKAAEFVRTKIKKMKAKKAEQKQDGKPKQKGCYHVETTNSNAAVYAQARKWLESEYPDFKERNSAWYLDTLQRKVAELKAQQD